MDEVTQPTQPSAYNPTTDVLRQELTRAGVVVRLMGSSASSTFHIDVKLKDGVVSKGDRKEWTFGRNEKACTYGLKIDSTRISNKHFSLWITKDLQDGGQLMIKDTSTNGTFLNNSKLEKMKNYILTQGDEISIGNGVPQDVMKFVVHLPLLKKQELSGIHADFIINDEIVGSGAFATVKKAIERSTGETFAVKIISKRKVYSSGMDGVTRELNILKNLDHPNIVKLKAFYEDSTDYYIVMEFVAGGDLMDFIAAYGAIEENPTKAIAKQIIEAIDHVHSKGISHRDLKPDNILIAHDDPVIVKITDFGLAKSKDTENTAMKTFCGTLAYLAPEIFSNKKAKSNKKRYLGNGKVKEDSYSNKVDMWSIGCLLFVVMTSHLPFSGQTQELMFNNISNGNYHEKSLLQKGISSVGRDFISRLIEPDVDLRLDAKQALEHPWLRIVEEKDIAPPTQYEPLSSINSVEQPPNNLSFKVPIAVPASQKKGTMLTLRLIVGDDQNFPEKYPSLVPIPQGQPNFFIGRLKHNDLEIEDERISKVHLCIMKRRHPIKTGMESAAMGLDDLWILCNGTNPSLINGRRLKKGQKCKLFNGDIICIFNDSRLKFKVEYRVEIEDWTGLYRPKEVTEDDRAIVLFDETDVMAIKPREEYTISFATQRENNSANNMNNSTVGSGAGSLATSGVKRRIGL